MIRTLSATLLIDDSPGNPGLLTEHGLSFWIEADGHRILFDTGQSDALQHNARALGIDLAAADAVVLSHGHYDHTGGLSSVMKLNPAAPVYCHPDVAVPRYSLRPDAMAHSIGMPSESCTALFKSGRVRRVSGPTYLSAGIGITGMIPRVSAFEDTGGAFFLDPEAKKPDAIEDDQSMWIEISQGIVIIAGCCHSGIVNTVAHIETVRPAVKIHAIIGGLHLLNASANRLEATVEALAKRSPDVMVPCHCTGAAAIEALQLSLGGSVKHGGVGMVIPFNMSCTR